VIAVGEILYSLSLPVSRASMKNLRIFNHVCSKSIHYRNLKRNREIKNI
jgi:hypothetical protein